MGAYSEARTSPVGAAVSGQGRGKHGLSKLLRGGTLEHARES